MATKPQLRQIFLERRRSLDAEQRRRAGAALVDALLSRVLAADRVAAFRPLPDEPPVAALLAARPDVLLPVLLPDGDLDWTAGGDRLGCEAVASCDLVLVPALAVDRTGARLGRGGGSYDRALARVHGVTVAVLYDGEYVDSLPSEPHDVPVLAVATPTYGFALVCGPLGQ